MNRKEALYLLQPVMRELQSHCQKIELAGQIRRGVNDIDTATIICIPQMVKVPHQANLFGSSAEKVEVRDPKFCEVVDNMVSIKGTSMQQQFTRMVSNLPVAFIVVNQNNWGLMLYLLTGSFSYTQSMLKRLETYGYRLKEHQLYYNGKQMAVPDEQTVYKFAHMPYSPPEMRGNMELAANR